MIRTGVARDPRFSDLDFGFDAGGLIRGAMNEGKSTPINIRVTGKDQVQAEWQLLAATFNLRTLARIWQQQPALFAR